MGCLPQSPYRRELRHSPAFPSSPMSVDGWKPCEGHDGKQQKFAGGVPVSKGERRCPLVQCPCRRLVMQIVAGRVAKWITRQSRRPPKMEVGRELLLVSIFDLRRPSDFTPGVFGRQPLMPVLSFFFRNRIVTLPRGDTGQRLVTV